MYLSDLVNLIKKGNSNFISANIVKDLNIEDAASLDEAGNHQISFLEDNNSSIIVVHRDVLALS